MKNKLTYLILSLLAFTGCISNDLPYPVLVPNVVSVSVDGAKNVEINNASRVITVYLEEYVDLKSVQVNSIEVDAAIAEVSSELIGVHDLSSPYVFTIRTYSQYDCKLMAVREI